MLQYLNAKLDYTFILRYHREHQTPIDFHTLLISLKFNMSFMYFFFDHNRFGHTG